MQFVWSYQIFCLLFYIAVFISRNQFGTDRSVYETVLTSDNATIAVPAGIVAVAVEGEEAVKTIVK